MVTKFSVKRLLSLQLSDMMMNKPPRAFLPLSKFAQNAYNFFCSRYLKDSNNHHSDDLGDWQVGFNSFPSTNFDAHPFNNARIGHDFSRKIHYSSHPLENKDEKEGKGVDSNISFAIVPKEKPEIVSHFLIKNYHNQEPISVALGMPLDEVEGWFQRFIRRSMFASICDVSVQAIDEKIKKRVGVLCSIIIDPSTFTRPVLNDYTDPIRHPVNAQMNEFYDSLENGLDPAEAVGIKKEGERPPKLLEHLYVSVHPAYANQGISSQMVELSESLASNVNNCRVGYTIATSEYSYAIFQKNGYKMVRESKYADYTNSKGEKIFAGKEDKLKPHHSCRAMVKEIKCLY